MLTTMLRAAVALPHSTVSRTAAEEVFAAQSLMMSAPALEYVCSVVPAVEVAVTLMDCPVVCPVRSPT